MVVSIAAQNTLTQKGNLMQPGDSVLLLLFARESALQGIDYLQPQLLQTFPFQYGQVVSKKYKGEGRYCGIRVIGAGPLTHVWVRCLSP